MAMKPSSIRDGYLRFKPLLLIILVQLGYTIFNFIIEASFNHGMNPHVFITYRHIVAGIAMFPFAYFLENKTRPKLTLLLFLEIFVLSLLGVSLSLNMYVASFRYTSPTFVSCVGNTTSALTFVIAVVLRLETLDLRNARGIAKVIGTLVSLAGVTIMTLYKGPILKNTRHHHPLIHIQGKASIHSSQWLKGALLDIASCISMSSFYIMQAKTLKRYPAQLSLTTWICFLGAAQSAVFTVIVAHEPADWRVIMGFDINFWCIIYGGVVASGVMFFIIMWCNEARGPVFVTMFNPVQSILVAILAYFVFGEKLFLGSIVGAIPVIVGLYLLLWGKEGDRKTHIKTEDQSAAAAAAINIYEDGKETIKISQADP